MPVLLGTQECNRDFSIPLLRQPRHELPIKALIKPLTKLSEPRDYNRPSTVIFTFLFSSLHLGLLADKYGSNIPAFYMTEIVSLVSAAFIFCFLS